MPYPVTIGKSTRISLSKIKEIADVPNLIELQVDSYKWFIEEGLKEVFEDISPIEDYTGNLILEFVDYSLDDKPKYDIEECKDRDATYCAPLKVKVRLINKETGEIKEQEVFMGDFPLMTEKGTFVINGAERVIVSQLVRSPGVYYALERDKTGKKLISSTVIPNRGAWLEYETDSNDVISVRVDRTRKQPVTVLLRALGIGTDAEIIELLGEDERLAATLEKDNTKTVEEGLIEIYKKLRPGEPPTVESASSLLNALFFDAKRYDLAKVGRYKFNKKLALCYRIMNKISAEDVVNPETGEVFVKAGEKISYEVAKNIQNAGINVVTLLVEDEKVVKVIGNNFVDIKSHVDFDIDELDIKEKVHYPTLKEILEAYSDEEEIKEEKEKVIAAGGLKIIGTERHESRRIDNQLRGRSGRQGDPGESKFYIGLDDDLMKIFGGDMITKVYNTIGMDENVPIENKLISNAVESAQKKVEGRNFSIRKNVLKYDDVMNAQREIIYKQRREVLDGENLKDNILNMIKTLAEEVVLTYFSSEEEVSIEALDTDIRNTFGIEMVDFIKENSKNSNVIIAKLQELALAKYDEKEQDIGNNDLRELERVVMLKVVDQKWMDHIDAMDELKDGIGLRAYGQQDPVVKYRIEGMDMFEEMVLDIKHDVVKILMNLRKQEDVKREEAAKITGAALQAINSLDNGEQIKSEVNKPVVNEGPKVGRNDPCPCGSGKKYKNCCGKNK